MQHARLGGLRPQASVESAVLRECLLLLGKVFIVLRERALLLGSERFGLGARAFSVRLAPLPHGSPGEHQQRRGNADREPAGATLLPQLLGHEVFFGKAADGRGEVGAEVDELRVARLDFIAIGPEVHPFRFGGEAALQRFRQRGLGRPFEVALVVVPRQLAGSQSDEQRAGTLMFEPIFNLFGDPGRRGGFAGGEQKQMV